MERRYANVLSDEKGLSESSLRVYLPLVPDLLGYLEQQPNRVSVRRLNAGDC